MRILIALTLLVSASTSWAQSCPEHPDQAVSQLTADLLLLVDQVSMLEQPSGVPSRNPFREQLLANDSALREASCQMLTDYPSSGALLSEAVAGMRMAGPWTGLGAQPDGNFGCLSRQQQNALAVSLLAGRVLNNTVGILCDTTSCVPRACTGFCALEAVTEALLYPIEASLQVDGFSCASEHYRQMSAWAVQSMGVSLKAGGALTLSELDRQSRVVLQPLVDSISMTVAKTATLQSEGAAVVAQIEAGNDRAREVADSVDVLSEQQNGFAETLERMEFERLLLPSDETPLLVLRLPGQFGGKLERVREIVADAINGSRDVGLPVADALTQLRAGDALFNSGSYDRAFESYRAAYLELVQ